MKFFSVLALYVFACVSVVYGNYNYTASDVFGNDSCFYCQAELSVSLLNKEQLFTAEVFSVMEKDKDLWYYVEVIGENGDKRVSSYYNGIFISLVNNRKRMYDVAKDSLLFKEKTVRGKIMKGIHKSGVPALLVPLLVKETVNDLLMSKGVCVEVVGDSVLNDNQPIMAVNLKEFTNNNVAGEVVLLVEKMTKRPVYYKFITNPGTLGEIVSEIKFTTVCNDCDVKKELIKCFKSLQNE